MQRGRVVEGSSRWCSRCARSRRPQGRASRPRSAARPRSSTSSTPSSRGELGDPVDDRRPAAAAARARSSSMICTPRVRNCRSRRAQPGRELGRGHRARTGDTSTGWSVIAGNSASIRTRWTSVRPEGGATAAATPLGRDLDLVGVGRGQQYGIGTGERNRHAPRLPKPSNRGFPVRARPGRYVARRLLDRFVLRGQVGAGMTPTVPGPTPIPALRKHRRLTDDVAAALDLSPGQLPARDPLRPQHVKPRLLGHWGTSPGINLMHVGLTRLILDPGRQRSCWSPAWPRCARESRGPVD